MLHSKLIDWNTTSPWYFGSSHPLYFDMLCQGSKIHRFKLIVKPDLSDASLHVLNSSELTPHNFNDVSFQSYMICEDTLVSSWIDDQNRCRVYTGLTSARFANIISDGGPAARMLLLPDIVDEYRLFPCPASGRFVCLDSNDSVFVLDFF